MLALGTGCTPAPQGDLLHIQEEQHQIGNPSRDQATATGIGCGGSDKAALADARRVAEYNLRSLTGEAHYYVQFRTLRQIADPTQQCVEVQAQAVPLLMH